MKLAMAVLIFFTNFYYLYANSGGYIAPQIGEERIVESVLQNPVVYSSHNEKEIVEKPYIFNAPQGWYILSTNIHNMQQIGEGDHILSTNALSMPYENIIQAYLDKTSVIYPDAAKSAELAKFNEGCQRLLQKVRLCSKSLNFKIWCTGTGSVVQRKVDVKLIYLGSKEEFEEYMEGRFSAIEKKVDKPSMRIERIHKDSFIDIVEEISSMLAQKMGKEEEIIFDFVDELHLFSNNNTIQSIQFIATSYDHSISYIVKYDFSSFNGSTYLIRKTIYGLSDFLRSADLTIQIQTTNQVSEIPQGWVSVASNIVMISFVKTRVYSVPLSRKKN